MKKFFAKIFRGLLRRLEDAQEITHRTEPQEEIEQVSTLKVEAEQHSEKLSKKEEKTKIKKADIGKSLIAANGPKDMRDIMVLMEVPIVALSKKRTTPIVHETPDGKSKVRISCHPPHYVASIYDWDIIIFVSSALQGTMNSGSDVPPRTLIIPRHELLKSLYRHDGKRDEKELKASLARLQLTGIETTIHNEDGKYDDGRGFLDSWGYTDRKDIKEFRITLSDWLYEITCCKGSLLKVAPEYFELTSGLKRFLYRTARKHVGIQNEGWKFTVKALHEKSGSEQELKKFKYDLKKAVADNDIPGYFLELVGASGKETVIFTNKKEPIKKVKKPNSTPIIEADNLSTVHP